MIDFQMEKQFRAISQILFAIIIAQFRAMKWCKREQSLRAIPRDEIPIVNPT